MVERIAKVLNLPAAYFYSENDIEADLLCRLHRLKAKDRKRILNFMQEIESETQ